MGGALHLSWPAVNDAHAQLDDWWAPKEAVAGSRLNLYATWEGPDVLEGLLIDVPSGVTVRDVRALRFGREDILVSVDNTERTTRATLDNRRPTPIEIIVTIDLPDVPFRSQWEITPLIRAGGEDDQPSEPIPAAPIGRSIEALPTRTIQTQLALDFSGDEAAFTLHADDIPSLIDAPYELEFWMRTTATREVIVSTWDGREESDYPLEITVGPAGRLFVFRGRPGRHESVSTRRPIADGLWHNVRIRAEREKMVLHIDGAAVDSFTTAFPIMQQAGGIALGGRLNPNEESAYRAFSGMIDAFSLLPTGVSARSRDGVRLAFENERELRRQFEGGRHPRIAYSDRLHIEAPRELSASLRDRRVELRWEAFARDGGRLDVEFSPDGSTYRPLHSIQIPMTNGDPYAAFSYEAQLPPDGVSFYRVVQTLPDGLRLTSRPLKVGTGPDEGDAVVLLGNFPNPFQTSTTIAYRLSETVQVELSVWDLSGQQIDVLVSDVQSAGHYETTFDAEGIPSGTYFIRLQTPMRSVSRKMIVAK